MLKGPLFGFPCSDDKQTDEIRTGPIERTAKAAAHRRVRQGEDESMRFLTKHLQRMIPVALLVIGGCAQSENRVTLHLDGWRLLTSEDVPGIVPPQRFWRNTTTGTVLTFSEHTPNSSEKDITAALAAFSTLPFAKVYCPTRSSVPPFGDCPLCDSTEGCDATA